MSPVTSSPVVGNDNMDQLSEWLVATKRAISPSDGSDADSESSTTKRARVEKRSSSSSASRLHKKGVANSKRIKSTFRHTSSKAATSFGALALEYEKDRSFLGDNGFVVVLPLAVDEMEMEVLHLEHSDDCVCMAALKAALEKRQASLAASAKTSTTSTILTTTLSDVDTTEASQTSDSDSESSPRVLTPQLPPQGLLPASKSEEFAKLFFECRSGDGVGIDAMIAELSVLSLNPDLIESLTSAISRLELAEKRKATFPTRAARKSFNGIYESPTAVNEISIDYPADFASTAAEPAFLYRESSPGCDSGSD